MISKTFLDSTTFVYIYTRQDPVKAEKCVAWFRELKDRDLAAASLQVANEFSNVLLRKFRNIERVDVFSMADRIVALGDFSVSLDTVRKARSIHLETGFSYWDCLLLSSALELNCTYFLSEDMKAGHRIGPLTIVNPMDTPPQTVIERH